MRLRAAPEFQRLETIRDEVMGRLVKEQVSKEAFRAAYLSGDSEQVRAALGYSAAEMQALSEAFNTSIQQLRANFPELESLDKATLKQCNAGGIDAFEARYDEAIANFSTFADVSAKSQAVNCEYGQYTVCLALAGFGAAATGPGAPLVYSGTAYLCLCSYCGGGWVDWVCF